MTIRRDLKILQEQNVVSLIHGGAALNPYHLNSNKNDIYKLPSAKTSHTPEKMRIGLYAAGLPQKSDSIIIDTGSTTEFIAKSLQSNSELTVICYAINIFLQVQQKKGFSIIFSGGYFHENTLMFESQEGLEMIKRNRARFGFISASGIDKDLGITCATRYETATKQAVLSSCKTRVLVADSSKFGKVGTSYFSGVNDFDILITDTGIPDAYMDLFRNKGVEVHTV